MQRHAVAARCLADEAWRCRPARFDDEDRAGMGNPGAEFVHATEGRLPAAPSTFCATPIQPDSRLTMFSQA